MPWVGLSRLSAILLLAGVALDGAAQGASNPPVAFVTDVRAAELPAPPAGFVWHRLDDIQVAVVTPADWKKFAKQDGNAKTIAFSPKPLDQNGQFDIGLTTRLLWHPQTRAGAEAKAMEEVLAAIVRGVESNKTDNKVLRGTVEDRGGKKMLIVRHRNAPASLPPIIVHTIAIGDPLTGLVYEFIFESPESSWDEN
jgi:hypothetical protein